MSKPKKLILPLLIALAVSLLAGAMFLMQGTLANDDESTAELEPPVVEVTTVPPVTPPAGAVQQVFTGDWVAFPNNAAAVIDSCHTDDFGSPVVEGGIKYALNDPALVTTMHAETSVTGFPACVRLNELVLGKWYYAAYVKTAAGDYYYGQVKIAEY